jgi:predicted RNA-binding Zn-ribbon protein involved in translation (DUF1610 family)
MKTMAEYIARASLPKKKDYWDDDFGAGYDQCLDDIAKIPAADVRPVVHGTWIPVMAHYTNGRVEQAREEAYSPLFKCSECGFEWISYDDINFCPNCGADMREES